MPAQIQIDFERDFESYMSSTERMRRMLLIKTEALRRIAVAPISHRSEIALRDIAEQALIESALITKTEVQDA